MKKIMMKSPETKITQAELDEVIVITIFITLHLAKMVIVL
jgi:hypothetical protein